MLGFRIFSVRVLFAFVLLFSACQPSLEHQPKIRTLEEPRTYVAGTEAYAPEKKTVPKLTRTLIARGQERYQIYCGVCHGLTGAGDGIATERGYGAPLPFDASLEKEGLAQVEAVIAQGKGRMMGFADRIPENDRYAIAVYTQVLSLRSHFPKEALK